MSETKKPDEGTLEVKMRRVTIHKWREDQSPATDEPFETVVREDEGFADLLKESEKNAPAG